MQSTVKLTGSDLLLFNLADVGSPIRPQGFGARFGPKQSVDVIYVSDHSLPPFAAQPASVYGIMKSDSIKYKEGAEAYALVYVCAEVKPLPPIRTGGLGNPMLSYGVEPPRQSTVRLLAHELAHVRQAWMLNTVFNGEYERAGPYERNIYEQIAYSAADKFINQNRPGISTGAFDRFLPKWITSAK